MKLATLLWFGAACAASVVSNTARAACPSGDKDSICSALDSCACDSGLHCDTGGLDVAGLCRPDGQPSFTDQAAQTAAQAESELDRALDAAAAAVAAAEGAVGSAAAEAQRLARLAIERARSEAVASAIAAGLREVERSRRLADKYATEATKVVSAIPADRLTRKVVKGAKDFLRLFTITDDGKLYYRYSSGHRAQLIGNASSTTADTFDVNTFVGAIETPMPASITNFRNYYNGTAAASDPKPGSSVSHRSNQSLVDDQGPRGTCTAMAATAALEALNDKKKVSKEYLFWAFKGGDYERSCESEGETLDNVVNVLQTRGVPAEPWYIYMPWVNYDIRFCPAGPTQLAKDNATIFAKEVIKLVRGGTSNGVVINNPRFLEAALAAGFDPVIHVGVAWESEADGMFETQKVHDVIVDDATLRPRPPTGGHAMLVVGYERSNDPDTGGGFFLMKNSWGALVGDGGYLKFSYDYVRQYATSGYIITGIANRPQGTATGPVVTQLDGARAGEATHLLVRGGVSPATLKYLSVQADGSGVRLAALDDYSGRQRFRLEPSSDGRYYHIRVEGGLDNPANNYLSVTADGTRVDLWRDDGSGRQRWIMEFPDPSRTQFTLRPMNGLSSDRKYLSVNWQGTKLDLWSSNDGSGRQLWTVDPDHVQLRSNVDDLARSTYRPIVHQSGKCLDVDGADFASGVNGGKVYGYTCNGQENQLWRIDDQGRLVSKNGKCLDVPLTDFNAKKVGARVTVWHCHDGANQKWSFQEPYLEADNELVLDFNNGALQLWTPHGGDVQHWAFQR